MSKTTEDRARALYALCEDLAGPRDDGTLGVVIRQALADDPEADEVAIRRIWAEATEEGHHA